MLPTGPDLTEDGKRETREMAQWYAKHYGHPIWMVEKEHCHDLTSIRPEPKDLLPGKEARLIDENGWRLETVRSEVDA